MTDLSDIIILAIAIFEFFILLIIISKAFEIRKLKKDYERIRAYEEYDSYDTRNKLTRLHQIKVWEIPECKRSLNKTIFKMIVLFLLQIVLKLI